MLHHPTFPAVLHVMLFALISKASAQGNATADIKLQPTSTIAATQPIASGNLSINAIPVTTPYKPVGSTNFTAQQQYIDSLITSKWAITVDVLSTDSALESRLSVSWPDGQGPSPNLTANQTQWDVCAVYFADLVDYFNNLTTPTNGTCFNTLGDTCLTELLALTSGHFSINPGCGGVVEILLPANCSQISTNLTTLNLTTFSTSTLQSSSPFIVITEAFDSTNRSTVLSTAMQRIWPVWMVEGAANRGATIFPGGCVQALNTTSNSSTIGASSSSGTGTASSTATSTAPAATSSTATSAAMSYRASEKGIWTLGVSSVLAILCLIS